MKIGVNFSSITIGGGVTYAKNLFDYWIRKNSNDELHVFCDKEHWLIKEYEGHSNIIFHKIRLRRPRLFWRTLIEQFFIPFKVFSLKLDVLYCPADIACILAPCKIILALRNPNIYLQTGVQWSVRERIRLSILKVVARISAIRASKIIFVSHSSKDEILKTLWGKVSGKLNVIYHGMDFHPAPRVASICPQVFRIGFVSTLYPYKGLSVLLESLCHFNASDPIEVLVFGRNMDRKRHIALRAQITNPNIKIRFFGGVEYKFIDRIYREIDLFVFPSEVETFGHPILESMRCQVPIIMADTPINREISDGNGFFFKPKDSIELKGLIEEFVRDRSLLKAHVSDAFKHSQNFTWEKSFDNLLKLISQIVEQKRKSEHIG